MLHALVEGKATAQEMAELAKKQLRKKIPELELALEGKVEEHHRFLLRVQLRRLRTVEEDLGILEQRIREKLKPYAAQFTLLQEIPGIDETLAAAIIAELGVDMGVFESVSQLSSWAGVCPGNNESAGKRRSSRIPKRQCVSQDCSGGGCQLSSKSQGHLPERQILPSQGSPWVQAGSRCSGP
jgi:transposase